MTSVNSPTAMTQSNPTPSGCFASSFSAPSLEVSPLLPNATCKAIQASTRCTRPQLTRPIPTRT